MAQLKSGEILTVFSIGLCFVLAVLAERLGYSVALGSFLAGILVAESGHSPAVEKSVQSVRDMFAAIFFVSIGMTVDPGQAMESLPAALLVFLVVVVGQFTAVSVAGILSGNGLRRSITAGLALGQIGEFAFILGAIGVSAGVVDVALQPILVTVAIGTAFTTPLLLAAAPRWVQAVDRLLPHRAQWLLGMYESWLGRMRRALDNPRSSRKVGRALRAIAFDAVALDIVFALTAALYDSGGVWFASRLSTSAAGGHIAVIVLAVIVAAPLVAAVGVYLWRNAGAMASELRSGAEHLAELLARQSAHDEPITLVEPSLPPGLDAIVGLTLHERSAAIGRTLSELDLRARTGATVLAIQRSPAQVILPTGRERLEAGDVLAISGSRKGVVEAQQILLAAAEEVSRPTG